MATETAKQNSFEDLAAATLPQCNRVIVFDEHGSIVYSNVKVGGLCSFVHHVIAHQLQKGIPPHFNMHRQTQ